MKYLVTGGAGFIGSHLCDRLLAGGHDVVVIDDLSTGKMDNIPDRVEFVKGSICDKLKLEALVSDIDGCFHLAAVASVERSRKEWKYCHDVNLGGMVNLLAAISRLDKKIPVVYASSAAIYGDCDVFPIDENTPANPITAYGADKLGCEQHAKVGALVHGIPSVGLRFFNVYGERQDPSSPYSGVISVFANLIANGDEITFFGNGEQTRDFVYVGDIVSALVASMNKAHSKEEVYFDIICVCTGRETSLLTLADNIEKIVEKKVVKNFAEARKGDIEKSVGSPYKMNDVLGVAANITLQEGLSKTLLG